MIKCVYCAGRGWTWAGTEDNADREPCYECDSTGRMRLNPVGVTGVLILITGALVSLAMIWWVHTKMTGAWS